MQLQRTIYVYSALHIIGALTVYNAHELFATAFKYSVDCECTLPRCVHLHRTLPLHRASVSTLALYTVSAPCTSEYTNSVHSTCIILHGVKMLCVMHPAYTQSGSNCAACSLGAHVQCIIPALFAPVVHFCAQRLL